MKCNLVSDFFFTYQALNREITSDFVETFKQKLGIFYDSKIGNYFGISLN